MDYTNTSNYTGIKPSSVEHWSRWFEVLKQTAEGQNIWHKVDPDMDAEKDDLLQEPEMPGTDVLEQYIKDRTTDDYTPTMLEAIQYYHVVHMEACRKHKSQETKELAIHKWIAITVNSSLHSSTLELIRAEAETGCRQVSLREITKKLKESFSPGLMVLTAETATQYKELLNDARWANTSPDKWIEKWNTVYQKAKFKGSNAIQDFIQAVGARFEPTWAEAKKVKMVEYNNGLPDHITLKAVAVEFMRQHNQGTQHTLKPQLCRTLLYAITGELVNKKRTPSKDLCDKIKQRYESPKWETLRALINTEGWSKPDAKPKELRKAVVRSGLHKATRRVRDRCRLLNL
ncbi:hypothetical protein E4U59_005531 [Claviceps monticola]|nr:hypothetical protein E4U59_005529 [Claviceps monticola]KAG5935579.1 hypothetical protein E4U59_005531 [Claviceps monticola]